MAISGCSDSTVPLNTPVDSPTSVNPREVPFVTVEHGPAPGEAEVSWWIVNWSTFPIEEYQVACSIEGPITDANWDAARIIGHFPQRKGQVLYREIFGKAEELVQGTTTWIAVRARDAMGNLSRLNESHRLTLTTEWWIEGRVLDLWGNPIEGSTVTSPHTGGTALTDFNGAYRVGPFRDIDTIGLVADGVTPNGSWYGLAREPIRNRSGLTAVPNQDFSLIPRNTIDPYCVLPDNEFLTYLRRMTFTGFIGNSSFTTILHRWDHYPLTVYIPPLVNDAGVHFDDGVYAALLIWNNAMGEDYLVRTDRNDGADIEFHYEEMQNFYGKTSLLLPSGPGTGLNLVIPEKMRISLNTVLPDLRNVTEISLHEFGHSLGLYNHSDCSAPGYLMKIAGGFGSLSREEPVHLDERRAVAAVRYLPQGQDMSMYWIDEPRGP